MRKAGLKQRKRKNLRELNESERYLQTDLSPGVQQEKKKQIKSIMTEK